MIFDHKITRTDKDVLKFSILRYRQETECLRHMRLHTKENPTGF